MSISEKAGMLRVLGGAVLISFSAVFVRLAHVSPTVSGFYRVFIGGIALLFLLLAGRRRIWFGRRHFLLAALCGLIFALDLYFWHRSILYVGPGLATILANFQVFILAVFGVGLLGERLTFRMAVAIPMALLGLFFLEGLRWNQLGASYRLGFLLGLAAAACYAAYILGLRKLQSLDRKPPAMANLAAISLIAAILLGLRVLATSDSFSIPDLQSLFSLLGLGVVSQVIGWVLISEGLPRIRSSLAGLLLLLQPSLSFTWDILFFHRGTDLLGALGAVITFGAIYLGSTSRPAPHRGRGRL